MPITESNVRIIAKLVAEYLGKHTTDARIKAVFPDLLKNIRGRLIGAVDDIELASIVAECILGPGAAPVYCYAGTRLCIPSWRARGSAEVYSR